MNEGNLFLPNGDQFTGAFKEDGTYDYGTLRKANGLVYFGDFENGHGSGVLIDEQGIPIYEPEFSEGLKSGVGILKDLDGSFLGEFLDGLPHGQVGSLM